MFYDAINIFNDILLLHFVLRITLTLKTAFPILPRQEEVIIGIQKNKYFFHFNHKRGYVTPDIAFHSASVGEINKELCLD